MQGRFEHANDDVLELYSLGILSEAEAESLEEHLLICAACQQRLTETDDYVRLMRAAAAKLRSKKSRRAIWSAGRLPLARMMPRLAWAAGAVCCLLAVAWVYVGRVHSLPPAGPPIAVLLQTNRGQEDTPVAKAPRGRVLVLQADSTGLPHRGSCDFEIVDRRGRPVHRSQAKREGDRLTAAVSNLGSGAYWVRLYVSGSREELLREYALRVE